MNFSPVSRNQKMGRPVAGFLLWSREQTQSFLRRPGHGHSNTTHLPPRLTHDAVLTPHRILAKPSYSPKLGDLLTHPQGSIGAYDILFRKPNLLLWFPMKVTTAPSVCVFLSWRLSTRGQALGTPLVAP